MATVKITFDVDVNKVVKKFANNDKVGLFYAQTVQKQADPYVPFRTGNLSDNVTLKPWEITYRSDQYASKVFYGTKMKFSKEQHPLATSRWDLAVKRAKGKVIANDLQNYIKSGRWML